MRKRSLRNWKEDVTFLINPFNGETTRTYWFKDKYDLILVQAEAYAPFNNGEGDCIGRTFEYFVVWKDISSYHAVRDLWAQPFPLRHPNWEKNDMSRDHLIYTILLMLESRAMSIRHFVRFRKWRISEKFSMTIPLWMWMRAACGMKFWKVMWVLTESMVLPLTLLVHKFAYFMGDFGPEMRQNKFYVINNDQKDKQAIFWRKFLFPSYTVYQYCWMIWYMKPGFLKNVMTRLIRPFIGQTNYLEHMLIGESVDPDDIVSYKSMSADRNSGYLEPRINDRDMRILKESDYPWAPNLLKENLLDKELLKTIYNRGKSHEYQQY